ncbi:MAG: FeoB-associated Cys-rich membrane protein [Ruminococcaceae bacterium]|nr:FeoB-associated Cys-rich membrane protein [Oscillospiraceae bacterium]
MLQYLPTILICIALAALFGLLLWSLIRDKKKGKSSCGGCCSSCAMGCHDCHELKTPPTLTKDQVSQDNI